MELLGDIGNDDQLTSARAENAVLSAKVKELSLKVKELELDKQTLQIENQSLLAEVEMYRSEAVRPSSSADEPCQSGAVANGEGSDAGVATDEFVVSGNGVFPTDSAVSLKNLHGISNPLCCALHPNDSLLATGGADGHLSLCEWGAALAPTPGAAEDVVKKAARVRCGAPVICVAFSQENRGMALRVVSAGCMDGSVILAGFGKGFMGADGIGSKLLTPSSGDNIKHVKYVKCMAWSPSAPILATASADGSVQLSKISLPNESDQVQIEKIQTIHLTGAIEALCFLDDGDTLCCYERGTPHLSYFDLQDGCKQTKRNLNGDSTGGFKDHVSFAVMCLTPSPNGGKYLAAATDTSRNIILESATGRQVRNLYGHKNDGFSQPKVAWSSNGQYLFGTTQDDTSVCIWDIASSSIVKRLDGSCDGHTGQIRDIYSSPWSDTLVTTSYDKTTKVWLCSM